jgi:hypothetical protein
LGLVGLCVLAFLLALNRAEWVPDDSDIALRYARNLFDGNGFCYTPGDSVLGSTSVLNPLLIAGIAVPLGGDLILARTVLFGLSLVGLIFLVHRSFRGAGRIPAFLAATSPLAIPLLYRTLGLETILVLLFATVSIQSYSSHKYRILGFCLGLLYLARPDGLVLALVLLAHFLWIRRRQEGKWRDLAWTIVLALFVVLPWFAYSWIHFGTPIPGTLGAKLAQRESGAWGGSFFSGLKKSLDAFDVHGLFPKKALRWLLFPSLLLGLRPGGPLRLLILWGLVLSLAYSLLNPPFYHWYGLPLHFSAVLGFFSALAWLWQRPSFGKPLALSMSLAFSALAFPGIKPSGPKKTYPEYREAAQWFRAHSPPGASIAAYEIGVLGFRIQGRPIRDLLGLVGPADLQAISRGDFSWWLAKPLPDFVLFHRPAWKVLETPALKDPRFLQAYVPVGRLAQLQLFKRR